LVSPEWFLLWYVLYVKMGAWGMDGCKCNMLSGPETLPPFVRLAVTQNAEVVFGF